MNRETAKYEQVPNSDKPTATVGRFKWVKYEVPILATFVILMAGWLFIDFAIFMRRLVNGDPADNKKGLSIVGLTKGYFGIQRDSHDDQWRTWRDNIVILLIVSALHLIIGLSMKKISDKSAEKTGIKVFQIVFGILFVGYLERAGIIYWILFTWATFVLIATGYRWRIFPIILWTFCLLTLVANKVFDGYGFLIFSSKLQEMDKSLYQAPVRWHIIFNMTMLKMISFGMDLHWSFRQTPVSLKNVEPLTYRHRQDTHQPLKNFNLLNYYAYLLYVPLFITGPTMSFNAWISQIYIPQKAYSKQGILKYALRFVFIFVLFEIFLHTIYVNAIATAPENSHIWREHFNTHHLLFMGLLELFFLWFKFMIIWRFARLWALVDGIESPENMNRCVANNYSFESFWRSWHRSFNQWLIRYVFVPLGGSKKKFLNVWIVFGFVALWHDINLNLVFWAWIICLTMMPEIAIKYYFYGERRKHLWRYMWFKYAAAALAGITVLSMVISNLVGYGTGYELLILIFKKIYENSEYQVLAMTYILIIAGVTLMFKIREREEDKGKMRGL